MAEPNFQPLLPDPLEGLARAPAVPIKPMSPSLNPANLTNEQWLLAAAERHSEQLRIIEKGQDELKADVRRVIDRLDETDKARGAEGWKVAGAIALMAINLAVQIGLAIFKH